MKFTVGLQNGGIDFTDCIIKNKEHIYEVYFSWGDFPNGRSSMQNADELIYFDKQEKQVRELEKLKMKGIKFNLLYNANCYGNESQSRTFFEKIGVTTDYIRERFGLESITTTSPLIAKFIKNNFKNMEVRASVNMEIGTVEGMKYISEYFDSFYMKREYNRNFKKIKMLSKWCKNEGKKMFMLANSGCLNFCSAHTFHDNLVAHESEISKMDNAYAFKGVCKEYLKKEENYISLINDTNFVRPEDILEYEEYFEAAKLATRVHRMPELVLESYVKRKYSGNILELLEPAHNIYPYVVENGKPLKLVKIDNVGEIIDVNQQEVE